MVVQEHRLARRFEQHAEYTFVTQPVSRQPTRASQSHQVPNTGRHEDVPGGSVADEPVEERKMTIVKVMGSQPAFDGWNWQELDKRDQRRVLRCESDLGEVDVIRTALACVAR